MAMAYLMDPKMPVWVPSCPRCHKIPGQDGICFALSIDTFCSDECRKAYYLAKGCQHCGRDYDNVPGWKLGNFFSYMATEVRCPRCVVEHPKWLGYRERMNEARQIVSEEIDELRMKIQELLPKGLVDWGDGIKWQQNSHDPEPMTESDLLFALDLIRSVDKEKYWMEKSWLDAELDAASTTLENLVVPSYEEWLGGMP